MLESWQCYKIFINYILWLHVKSFIPAKQDPFFMLRGFRFGGTKCSHVINLAHLRWKFLPPFRDEIWFPHFAPFSRLDMLKFNPGKPGHRKLRVNSELSTFFEKRLNVFRIFVEKTHLQTKRKRLPEAWIWIFEKLVH